MVCSWRRRFKTLLTKEPKVSHSKSLPPAPMLTMSLARAPRPDEKAGSFARRFAAQQEL